MASDPGSQLRLSRWCQTVGPVFFEPHAASIATPTVDQVAIVSWNIHEGRGDVDEMIRRLRLGEFTAGQPIDQFVLLLQEGNPTRQQCPAARSTRISVAPPHRGAAGAATSAASSKRDLPCCTRRRCETASRLDAPKIAAMPSSRRYR